MLKLPFAHKLKKMKLVPGNIFLKFARVLNM